MTMVLLGFGSSARRGAVGWTDRERIRQVLDALRPDATVDGKSPAGGADQVFWEEAVKHFRARGDTIPAQRCPVDHAFDGPWPAAGHRRNARMYRTHKPSLAVGFISGAVGSPLSSGSAGMLNVCLRGLPSIPPCPVVVYRDNGVEPYADLGIALPQFRRLYVVTRDPALVIPGQALASHCEVGEPPANEVLAALTYARDGSRWAPWIEAIETTVKKTS